MTTLTQKSQVTIPKQFRLALGLRPGDDVDFEWDNGQVVLRKKARKLPFDKWRGVLKGYTSKKFNEEFR
ncbi:AbrB/MazE/SpoVT family DNA-binding domain-containing protein [Candidatus Woesearchaeota archaeon]|nr:AbrB/MazE/SpoVT family DNA-binding domain-containing protein [Candidatus Woesearchaeota archaeon]